MPSYGSYSSGSSGFIPYQDNVQSKEEERTQARGRYLPSAKVDLPQPNWKALSYIKNRVKLPQPSLDNIDWEFLRKENKVAKGLENFDRWLETKGIDYDAPWFEALQKNRGRQFGHALREAPWWVGPSLLGKGARVASNRRWIPWGGYTRIAEAAERPLLGVGDDVLRFGDDVPRLTGWSGGRDPWGRFTNSSWWDKWW